MPISGQTKRLAPADGKLYALRDVTGTVPSIPLISASIMCKKLAEGIDSLVLDVKVGSGAFMKTREQARELAQTMTAVGRAMDKKVAAVISDMSQPLGRCIGNSLEVYEALEVLEGEGPGEEVGKVMDSREWKGCDGDMYLESLRRKREVVQMEREDSEEGLGGENTPAHTSLAPHPTSPQHNTTITFLAL